MLVLTDLPRLYLRARATLAGFLLSRGANHETLQNVKIDWTVRENVRAQMRVQVKRILKRYGYPPDKQAKATETVLEQAAVLSQEWAAA